MTSDEGMMCAARVMQDAAELNQRAADRIEEAVRQMQILFDAGYGGTAPRLLEELEKANNGFHGRDDRREERTVNALVRQFIVQERFNEGEWMDDPDQPDDYTHGFEQAKWWMENDNKTCMGHETTYEHRIIERTETQVWPNAAAHSRAAQGETP